MAVPFKLYPREERGVICQASNNHNNTSSQRLCETTFFKYSPFCVAKKELHEQIEEDELELTLDWYMNIQRGEQTLLLSYLSSCAK